MTIITGFLSFFPPIDKVLICSWCWVVVYIVHLSYNINDLHNLRRLKSRHNQELFVEEEWRSSLIIKTVTLHSNTDSNSNSKSNSNHHHSSVPINLKGNSRFQKKEESLFTINKDIDEIQKEEIFVYSEEDYLKDWRDWRKNDETKIKYIFFQEKYVFLFGLLKIEDLYPIKLEAINLSETIKLIDHNTSNDTQTHFRHFLSVLRPTTNDYWNRNLKANDWAQSVSGEYGWLSSRSH